MGVIRVYLVVWLIVYCFPEATGLSSGCPVSEQLDLTDGIVDRKGAIRYAGNIYPPEEYLIEPPKSAGGSGRYYSCVCARRKCVYVCCYFVNRTNCEESSLLRLNRTVAGVTRVSWAVENLQEIELRNSTDYWLIYADPPAWANTLGHVLRIDGHEGELIADGSFAYGEKVYASRTYCINPVDGDDSMVHVWIKETDEHLEMHHWHSLGMIVSLPFLIATLIVYALIPELRNIPGKSLMCYVFSLTASYVTMILIKRSVVTISSVWCSAIGYLCYLSLMSSFFWLNLMAFDIYWTFGGHRRRTTDPGLFRMYCGYAYGFPVLFLLVALLADYSDLMDVKLRPGFGDGQCLFKSEQLISFVYLYLPLVVLVSVNMFFFISTAVKIAIIERATATALQGESGRHGAYANERNRFGLYVRLFVVMGITWTFEFVTWVIGERNWMVHMADICNCVSGVFIFFLFVWKRKVWLLLQQRLRGKKVIKRTQPLFSVSAPSRMTSVT
ncbi:AGAP006215-PA-like protein [Anopheles sinensis]|uniref:AGAP006215-PA-like protein n=1 Tax=Anopheles sinensis TaxID=74873 RepID=A0A084WK37_ANOSI|nr:AGAP006215-PA-like protein [Anopheles sinensis]